MINREFFFNQVRGSLFHDPHGVPKITPSQVTGLTAILDEWEANHWEKDDRWLAYALATPYHETDKTMQPIREYGRGKDRKYGRPDPQTGQIYYGRGLVQLTWFDNYRKAKDKFGVDFVDAPDLALEMEWAVKILFWGMENGIFTGMKLGDYFNANTDDPVKARRIINGNDKANIIADYYHKFYAAISYTK